MEALSVYLSLDNLEKIVSDDEKRHLIEGIIAVHAFFASRASEKENYYYNSDTYAAISKELEKIKYGLDNACKKIGAENITAAAWSDEILNWLHKSALKNHLNEIQFPQKRPFAFVSRMMPDGIEQDKIAKVGELIENAIKTLYSKNTLQKAQRMGGYDNITQAEYDEITKALREYYSSIKDVIKAAKPASA